MIIERCDSNGVLWKYMDFTKFVALIEKEQSLYFPDIFKFEDALEGLHNALGIDDHYDITNTGEIIVTGPPSTPRHVENSRKYKTYLNQLVLEMAQSIGVQCWRFAEHENHAMWKIFLSSNEGVAIKTNIEKLKECLPDNLIFHLGRVNYMRRNTKKISTNYLLESFFTKESHFDHECEYRIITYDVINNGENHFGNANLRKNDEGIVVPINVNELINEIVVSPYAPTWFYKLVLKVKATYGLSAPVSWSEVKLR